METGGNSNVITFLLLLLLLLLLEKASSDKATLDPETRKIDFPNIALETPTTAASLKQVQTGFEHEQEHEQEFVFPAIAPNF